MSTVKHDLFAEAVRDALTPAPQRPRRPITRGWLIYHMFGIGISMFGLGFMACMLVTR